MKSFFNFQTITSDKYACFQSLSIGMASALCTYVIDSITYKLSPVFAPILTFAVSTSGALFYLLPCGTDDEQVSFKNYKIDYEASSLGGGKYGEVRPLILRPDNEKEGLKGYLFYLLPYGFDDYYRIGNNKGADKDNQYCVKIQKQLDITRPTNSFLTLLTERLEKKESNRILRDHKLTNVKFYASNSFFSQIKTRIQGNTLRWHINHGSLINPKNYEMRKRFVLFYRSLSKKSSLLFSDIHSNNIMYDENQKQWEIIDGAIVDVNKPNESILYKLSSYITYLDPHGDSFDLAVSEAVKEHRMLAFLRKVALSKEKYTIVKDNEILSRYAKFAGPSSGKPKLR